VHALIVEFHLVGMDEEGYRTACAQLAPAVAELPGLLAKVWLSDPDRGAHGGVYLFRDRAAMDGYLSSDLFATVKAFPHFAGITARDFAVDEDVTRVTQPGIAVLAAAA
jgi:hypothetical protein